MISTNGNTVMIIEHDDTNNALRLYTSVNFPIISDEIIAPQAMGMYKNVCAMEAVDKYQVSNYFYRLF